VTKKRKAPRMWTSSNLSGSIVAGVLALAAMRRDAQESAPRQGIRVEMAVRAFNRTLTEPVFFPCTRGIRFR
jgi:hypothetical protein